MERTFFPTYTLSFPRGFLSKVSVLLFFLSGGLPYAQAQMSNGQDTLYGNEWIDYGKTYYKIPVAEDGMYKISYEALLQSGLSLDDLSGSRFQLFHLGEETPLYVSTEGPLSTGDYLLFYGEKNRGELDRHLFQNPDKEMLNPQYSMFTDTAVYYLTWVAAGTPVHRYRDREMDFSDPPAREAYFMDRARVVFSGEYSKSYTRFSGVTLERSNFTAVEGFGSGNSRDLSWELTFPNVHRKIFNIELPGLAPSAATGELRIRFGCGPGDHHQELSIEGETYGIFKFSGFQVKDTSVIIPALALRNELEVQLEGKIIDESTQPPKTYDGQTVAYAEVSYPRNFNFQDQPVFFFDLPASAARRYLEITDFDVQAGETPVLFDLTENLRYEAVYENGLVKILLPPATQVSRLCLLNEQRGVLPITNLEAVSFTNYDDLEGNYIILSHPALFDDGAGGNPVQEYADYRAFSHEGEHRPVIVDVTQLYEQFAYGLQRHPLAIRNFAHYIKRNWTNPQYFFIIGKGREFNFVRSATQFAEAHDQTFFVPTFGYPGSDNLLLSDNGSSAPVMAVGRVPAVDAKDIRTYLDKVKALEDNASNPQTIEGRRWMKRIMHLGGGANAGEQLSIQNGLRSMERIIANNRFGANITSFYKTSTDAVEQSIRDRIMNTINGGLSIITFFGHSSPGTFEVNIEDPSEYRNAGKCPLILSLGCLSGNVFTGERSIGERFVLDYGDKGAVAFGATRGYGTIYSLALFANRFYQFIGEEFYGRGIGDVLRAAIADFDDQIGIGNNILIQQFNLNGDPAIRLHPAPGPDYTVDTRSVRFSPKVVTAQMDSFALSFDVVNLGQNLEDSLNVLISWELPSGQKIEEVGAMRIATPAYSQTVTFMVPGQGSASVGPNTFFITLDPENDVSELPPPDAELNNELKRSSGALGIPLVIIDNTARPVYPPEFGIIGSESLTLKASTTDPLAEEQTYILEFDTTALFNSPSKLRREVTQRGGVIQWPLTLDLTPEEVYYWRVSPDSAATGLGYAWEESSFTYIPGVANGWNQGDYWQYLKGDTSELKGNQDRRKLEFLRTFKSFRIKNKVDKPEDPAEGYINNIRWSDFFRWERPQSINIVVFDTLGQIVWNQIPGEYGSINIGRGKEIACFLFPVDTPEERLNIINFIENIIPNNFQVYVYTAMRQSDLDLQVNQWSLDSIAPVFMGRNLFNVLERQGASQVRLLKNTMRPYIFGFRKDNGAIVERIASSIDETLNYETAIQGFRPEGTLTSPLIGPAAAWTQFNWNYSKDHEYDIGRTTLVGISPNGAETVLKDSISEKVLDLSSIPAQNYPFLKLKLFAKDSIHLSPVDLNYWRVLYRGVPDVALNPAAVNFAFHSDTLSQGDHLQLNLPIENVTDYSIDSLDIQYILRDQNNDEELYFSRIPGISGQGTVTTNFELNTRKLSGPHALVITVNPSQNPSERTYFNNLGNLPFYVQSDQRNPLLDVTFDGQPIMDGDLVSARPQINIRVEDENTFLLLQDTSLFELSLEYPDKRITAIALGNNPQIQFYPASGEDKNRAEIIFTPEFVQDGDYRLLIKARDVSGNKAGAFAYEKKFQVITKRSISNVLNYPNPFSTATQFVYTLTGDQPPTFFKVQIMTTSGRIVREITEAELGPLRVGTHRTEYAWDGRDEYGDQLANGVYLYRIVAKDMQGKDYEHYDNGLQGFFKQGFGKMVILR
jgi:hypothetical protein